MDEVIEAHGALYRFNSQIPKPPGLRWSIEHVAAFAACALWTYVSLPFVLPEIDVEERGNQLVGDSSARPPQPLAAPAPSWSGSTCAPST